ncbi:MAG: DUF2116 family Zn-ribbon domain-containing protein [Betaproteobacteria bacterium]|nr:DUF2116 family Zn-ribbon domain-containing protein [Betaproteobacteria bacterium]
MNDVQDLADQAEAAEQRHRDAALAVRKPSLLACGQCHFCAEPLRAGLLFCDLECRDLFEREQAARRRNGG